MYSGIISSALDVVRWFNNHSGALELLHQAQKFADPDRLRPLVLILPAKTRWTSHFQCAARLLLLSVPLRTVVVNNKEKLLDIAAKSQTDNAAATARKVIASIEDAEFWARLDRIHAHLEPLAIATNILQASNTRLDHVLLTLANLFRIYNSDNIEPDVRERMTKQLEFHWNKGAGVDQGIFILAVFLNPYIRGYCFNREALSTADLITVAEDTFARLFGCDPDADFSDALVDYSNGVAEFSDERMGLEYHQVLAEKQGTDPNIVRIWTLIDRSNEPLAICPGRNGLTRLAIRVLSVAANSAGPERAFSSFGATHTKMRNRLGTDTVHKTTTVRMAIRREYVGAGLVRRRLKRKLGLDNEPLSTPDSNLQFEPEPESSDNPGTENDFEKICAALVSAAIDSLEPDEAEPEEEDSEEAEMEAHGLPGVSSEPVANTAQAATAAVFGQSGPRPLVLSADELAQSVARRRRTRRKPKPLHIPLEHLFLYPSAPSSSPGDSTARPRCSLSSQEPASDPDSNRDAELRKRYDFIWRGGVRNYTHEMLLCELSHPGPHS
ncbi:ribonuclease H-like domain-containing protein [Cubamyces lactineus]|nr:ribonuclease H-like domain-containing protein [Cubamyces lactineus]